jgi:hypothetical protein
METEIETGRTKSFEDSIFSEEIHGNVRVINYQPGNMTRYILMITRLEEFETTLRAVGVLPGQYWAVTLFNGIDRTVILRKSASIGPYDVTKLTEYEGDRLILAEFIEWLMMKEQS